MAEKDAQVNAFIAAACVPLHDSHASGTLDDAAAILAANPEIAAANIYTAAILGDEGGVRRFIALDPANAAAKGGPRDPASATAKGGPRDWDALTYLCFSRYLRLDRARSDAFVRTATVLLDAGASANTGWFENNHQPSPVWESAIYGAAGIANHAGVTQLLLERGADPNDEETPYHVPETYDLASLKVIVESGKLSAESLATMLLRKADWHDLDGIVYLLEHGADPNRMTRWGYTAFQQALRRDNALSIIEALLDHGADPALGTHLGMSGIAMSARQGRRDVLELLERRGIPIELHRQLHGQPQGRLHGVDALIAACARGNAGGREWEPPLAKEVLAIGGTLLATFSGTGNTAGVRDLLDLGVPVDARFTEGDGYWGIPKNALAIQVAAWRAQHEVVQLLIDRGSPVDVPAGPSPIALAVRACVDSYWTNRRSPASVAALLRAGAKVKGVGIRYPSGYAEVDDLLRPLMAS